MQTQTNVQPTSESVSGIISPAQEDKSRPSMHTIDDDAPIVSTVKR